MKKDIIIAVPRGRIIEESKKMDLKLPLKI